MKKLLPVLIAVLLLTCSFSAFANTTSQKEEDPVSSLFGELLAPATEAASRESEEENAVYEVEIDASGRKATLGYSVTEEAEAELRIYNDYEDASEKQLLFTLGPVELDPESDSVTLTIPKYKLPKYFMAEAVTTTVSGKTNTLEIAHYSKALTFARSATAADFKEGYYVAIGTEDADSRSGPRLFSAAPNAKGDEPESESSVVSGYVAYNENLILLGPDTVVTAAGDSVILSPIPEELTGMTEEELNAAEGFVVRGTGSLDNDTFLLNNGVTLGENSITVMVREPEALDDIYSAVNLSLKGGYIPILDDISGDGIEGKLHTSPTADADISLNGWKIELTLELGLESDFDLNIEQTFDWINYGDLWDDPPTRSTDTFLPDIGLHYWGFGVRFATKLHYAANGPVHVTGSFKFSVRLKASLSGVNVHRGEAFQYNKVEPRANTANRNVYVYVGYNYTAYVEGFYFNFKIFKIGPVIDLKINQLLAGRAVALLSKNQEQAIGDDVLHDCAVPGAAGCLRWKTGHKLVFSGKIEIDVFFKEASFKLWEKENIQERPADLDYFYHSYAHNEWLKQHGKEVFCPHELYRFSARVTENIIYDIENAVISGSDLNTEVSSTITDERGKANPLYMSRDLLRQNATIAAAYDTGAAIGESPVTDTDLVQHREIKINGNQQVITRVNVSSWWPPFNMYAGTAVETTPVPPAQAHYSVDINYRKGSERDVSDTCDGIAMSASWNGQMPDGEELVSSIDGINHCIMTIDFSTYGDGTVRIDPNDFQLYLGIRPGNDHVNYVITGYQIEDKEVMDVKTGETTVLPSCILVIEAEFLTGSDEDYVKVIVDNGLNSVSSHFYKVGNMAIAIAKDVSDVRDATLALIPELSLDDWNGVEKELLKDEIYYALPPEDPFDRWVISSGGQLKYPEDVCPVISEDGVISYNTIVFKVPKPKNRYETTIHLSAMYDSTHTGMDVKWVDTLIKKPIPGESFGDEGYSIGKLTTDPMINKNPSVSGINGEEMGLVKLKWFLDGNETTGKIRFNTTYTVKADVIPRYDSNGKYRFTYPLQTERGTKAYFTPVDQDGKKEEQKPANAFIPIYQDVPSILPEENLPVVKDLYNEMIFLFTTEKALLLEILPTDDLWFAEGTTPEYINAILRQLGLSIITEDESTTSADANWEAVTEIPGPGESFDVPGVIVLPDNIRNEDRDPDHKKVDENVKVTIHIYGADELDPPAADPKPGVYRKDIGVKLSHKEENVNIYYRIDIDNVSTGDYVLYDKTKPIELKRSADKAVTYTISAYAEKSGIYSPTTTFTYVLMPTEGEYTLTMIGGTAKSNSGSGTGILYVPAGANVKIEPREYEGLVFDHWTYSKKPEFTVEPDPVTGKGEFVMPSEDLTVTAVFEPKEGYRLITKLNMTAPHIHLGTTYEQLPKIDTRTSFFVDIPLPYDPFIIGTLIPLDQVTELAWNANAPYPVTYGSYTFNADYAIAPLVERTKYAPADQYRITENTVFAPSMTAFYNNDSMDVIVSDDGKTAIVAYTYTFNPEYYTVKYDVNGGQYGEVPLQVRQLTTIATTLTDAEPYRQDGSKFLGWSTDPQATEPEYIYDPQNPEQYSFTRDITLYAVWAPYTVEIRWLDNNNAQNTRTAFDVTLEDGTIIHVDPAQAENKNGVGIESYTINIPDSRWHDATIPGLDDNNYVTFGKVGESNNIYAVDISEDGGKMFITLLAKRELTVEKEWEIDLENNDKPKSINVILQSTKKPQEDPLKLLNLIVKYVQDGGSEDRDAIIKEVEKITGYSLKGLTPEAAGSKVMHLIASGKLNITNLTEALKSLLTADTDDSKVGGTNWYAHQKITLSGDNSWKGSFEPEDRFNGTFTVSADGSITAKWDGEAQYRIREKAGKSPVENGKDAVYTVPAYTNLVGKRIDEHKTVYVAKYRTSGDNTHITNTAVEDHYIEKFWELFGDAKQPDEVYAMLLWQYDSEYLDKAKDILGMDITSLWLPEDNPISGNMISIRDLIKLVVPDIFEFIVDLVIPKLNIPLAIAKLNEANNWRAHFRIRKYGNFGLPLKHESAEFFSAICQDILKYFLGVDIPIGFNPLKNFVSISIPEISVPLTTDKYDGIVNTWAKWEDDDDEKHHIGGSKVWEDDNNSDKIRPSSVTFHVYEDGWKHVTDITVKPGKFDKDNFWTWMYKSDSIDTKNHSYSVTEDAIDGYTAEYHGLSVTNKHTSARQKYVDLHIVKSWNEEAELEHEPITVTVLRNGEAFKSVTLSADKEHPEFHWTADIPNVDKYDSEGRDYVYSVEEDIVPEDYTVSYEVAKTSVDGKTTWNLYVTNTPGTPEKISISGRKIWDDNGDREHRRPESVTIRLKADGTEIEAITLSEENSWAWSREVNKYTSAGTEIVYSITEDELPDPDYKTTINGLDVTNRLDITPVPDTWTVEIKKVWEGDTEAYPKVPVTVYLTRNGADFGSPVTLDENNGWKAEISGLEKTDSSGKSYTYAVRETPVPNGFTVSYSSKTDGSANRITMTVLNRHVSSDDTISGTKIWADDNDFDGVRPNSITLHIWENGREKVADVIVSRADNLATDGQNYWNWSYTGPEIATRTARYSISEDTVPGYTTQISGYNVTNTHKSQRQETVSVTVMKRWEDHTDISHDPLSVTVLRNGLPLTQVTLDSDYDWTETLRKLDRYDADGHPYSYSIEEKQVPSGYRASYSVTQDAKGNWNCEVTNTPGEPEKKVIKGKKIWDDQNDRQGKRPESVTIHLFADKAELDTFTLSEKNGWAWSREVDKYNPDGTAVQYSVTEEPIAGTKYETTIDGLNVTNRLEPVTPPDPDKVTVAVKKAWDGLDNEHVKVPVTVTMTRNGEKTGEPVTLSEDNGWCHTFGTFPKKDAASETILYGVIEDPVPEGCYASYACNVDSASKVFTWTVTNTYTTEDPIGGRKIWNDEDDAAGYRPDTVEFIILANGNAVDRKTLNVTTNWEWSGLYPKTDDNGKAITYTVTEEPVRYYDESVSEDGLSITNSILSTQAVITKTWLDENNKFGTRPESIPVTITYAPYSSTVYKEFKTVTLTGDSLAKDWALSISLPVRDELGNFVHYRIKEDISLPNYLVAYDEPYYDEDASEWSFRLTNTLVGPLTVANHVVHGNTGRLFTFDIALEDLSGDPFSGSFDAEISRSGGTESTTLSFTGGASSFELADGESITLLDVPVGWRYTVRERTPYSYRVWCVDKDNELDPSSGSVPPAKKALKAAAAPVIPDPDGYPTYTTAKKRDGRSLAEFYNDAGFTVKGRKTIDGKTADADVEEFFTFELLDENMLPVIDDDGCPVQASNEADGSFTLTAHLELAGPTAFYVREINDRALTEDYILDTSAHAVTVSMTGNAESVNSPEITVINNRRLTELTVYKRWVGDDQGAVTLNLRANGKRVTEYDPERSGNTYTFRNIPFADEQGNKIVWSAVEDVPAGYIASYSNVGEYAEKTNAAYDGGTIVNRPAVKITIKKVWVNAIVKTALTIEVYRDGTLYRTVKKTPAEDGTITFSLPKYGSGLKEYEYTFREAPMAGFDTTYSNVDPHADETEFVYAGGTITNTGRDVPPPRTGDDNRPALFAALGLFSLLGLAGTVLMKRKRLL